MCKISVWAWHCDAPQGGYLFHGNPNRGLPPFHLGGIEDILYGEHLVWEHTRKALEMDVRILEWNEWFPGHRVKPKLITIEMRPADRAAYHKEDGCRLCDIDYMMEIYHAIKRVLRECREDYRREKAEKRAQQELFQSQTPKESHK